MNAVRTIRSRVRHDQADSWEMLQATPDPRLAGRIGSYVDYWERTTSFAARRELAATSGVLLYALGEPLEIVGADGRTIVVRAGEAFVGGVADGTSLSRGRGLQRGLHVHMPLASIAALTGAPLAALANRVAPLADVIGRDADDLGDALCEADGAEARFALIDRFLTSRLSAERAVDRPVAWAMSRLASAKAPSASALALDIGWSRKHFAKRFRTFTGFAPDRFRRLARFERFARLIARRPADGLAGLAVEAGYFDQPHLTREVADFARMTPAELRARLIPGEGSVRDD